MIDKSTYTVSEIEVAFRTARKAIKSAARIHFTDKNNPMELTAMSFEQVMRASLRLDNTSEGRGGRSPITNKGGQNG